MAATRYAAIVSRFVIVTPGALPPGEPMGLGPPRFEWVRSHRRAAALPVAPPVLLSRCALDPPRANPRCRGGRGRALAAAVGANLSAWAILARPIARAGPPASGPASAAALAARAPRAVPLPGLRASSDRGCAASSLARRATGAGQRSPCRPGRRRSPSPADAPPRRGRRARLDAA